MSPRQRRSIAPCIVLMLLLAACSSGSGSGDPSASGDPRPDGDTADESAQALETDPDGTFTVALLEPGPISPTGHLDVYASRVLGVVFSPLVTLDHGTDEPVWGDDDPWTAAEDITTTDNVVWTITLKPGFTWHDGTPLVAQDYVDTMNFTALSTNGQSQSSTVESLNIVGFADLQASIDDEGEEIAPAAETLAGLRAVDERTIEMELESPDGLLPARLLDILPAHPSFFDDPEAGAEAPIGTGPFMFEEWIHDERLTVTRYDAHPGGPAGAAAIEFTIFTDSEPAFLEYQAGTIDVLSLIPGHEQATAAQTYGDRFLSRPVFSLTFLGSAPYLDGWDGPEVMRALSLAIDRQAISDALFGGVQPPADAFSPPGMIGTIAGGCSACTFDPETAADIWADVTVGQPFSIHVTDDPTQVATAEAIANQWRQHLGAEVVVEPTPLNTLIEQMYGQTLQGPFFIGFSWTTPTADSFLAPLLRTGAGFNVFGFSDPEFDDLLDQARSARSVDEGLALYDQAAALLDQQMPFIPVLQGVATRLISDRLTGVELSATGVALADVQVLADTEG